MRAVLQRVKRASVEVDGKVVGKTGKGIVALIGIGKKDSKKDIEYIGEKILNLRIFEDQNKKMNLSLKDINGEILVISQFTLYGDCKRGRRPSFTEAAPYDEGKEKFDNLVSFIKSSYNGKVETGVYGAEMLVSIFNDGPVTIILDTEKLK